MDIARSVAAVVLCLLAGTVHAQALPAYIDATPPSTYNPRGYGNTPSIRMGAGTWTGSTAANDAVFRTAANDALFRTPNGPRVATTVNVRVGANSYRLPAAYRVASNAAALVARGAWTLTRMTAVGLIGGWLLEQGINWVFDQTTGQWIQQGTGTDPIPRPYCYYASAWSNGECTETIQELERAMQNHFDRATINSSYTVTVTLYEIARDPGWAVRLTTHHRDGRVVVNNTDGYISSRYLDCPTGYRPYGTGKLCIPLGAVAPRPVTAQEWNDAWTRSTLPLPAELLPHLPDGIPVEPVPVINPQPYPAGEPAPVWIPTGPPRPAPEGAPEPYTQPGVIIVPAPQPGAPNRVEIRPQDRPAPTPEGWPLPAPYPNFPPGANPQPWPQPKPDPNNPKPQPEPSLLCQIFPRISACAELGQATEQDRPEEEKREIQFQEKEIGPLNGTCPADKSISIMGFSFGFSYQPICDFAKGLRPIILASAWLSAILIFATAARGKK